MSRKCRLFLFYGFVFLLGVLVACGSNAYLEQTSTLKIEPTVTPSPTSTAANTLEKQLNQFMRIHSEFSGTILVAVPGEDLIVWSYGLADRENDVPNTAKTKFGIGSITKSFTAMAIMILEERGLLKAEDSICQHIKDCPKAWKPVTIHHLLTHTSGIPRLAELYDQGEIDVEPCKDYLPDQVIAFFKELPLDFQPGSGWQYSNSGYVLLGKIIENVSNQSYDVFLHENILQPLGMNNTGYSYGHLIIKNRASGYSYENFQAINAPYWDVSLYYSSGGLYSTVGDLYKWDQAFYGNELVSKETLDRIFSSAEPTDTADENYQYGYGWGITKFMGQQAVGHHGSVSGFDSMITRYPDAQVTIIALSNYDHEDTASINWDLAGIVFKDK
jgi:CubicO group peptidase (beta-lactamase class C family)